MVGVSAHSLYKWKKAFDATGPAGLMDQQRGPAQGSRLPDITKRAILMMKEAHPEYGCHRISDLLTRGPALGACATSVARVLHEAGYVMEESVTHPHPDKVRRFERDLVATGIRKILHLELSVAPESWTATLRGCGMLIVNPPWKLDTAARPLLAWLSRELAQPSGGASAVRWLVPE